HEDRQMARRPESIADRAQVSDRDARPDREELSDRFNHYASRITSALGSVKALVASVLIVVIWALTGPIFHFSDTWQLFINTTTTIVTFLMVFLIQNTQNRDAKAIQLKLDELIRSKRGARNSLVDLENCTDEELEEMEREFKRV